MKRIIIICEICKKAIGSAVDHSKCSKIKQKLYAKKKQYSAAKQTQKQYQNGNIDYISSL